MTLRSIDTKVSENEKRPAINWPLCFYCLLATTSRLDLEATVGLSRGPELLVSMTF